MVNDFIFKDKYLFDDLVNIVSILRSPEGCPWDREQNHKSIRKNLIEETYETVEAIDASSPEMLQEELGDVLLQVAMHSQMEKELGNFEIGDVIDGICKKLVRRHPHVFGDAEAAGPGQALRNWDAIKKLEKNPKSGTELLQAVPRVLPALMRSQKVQHRAEKADLSRLPADPFEPAAVALDSLRQTYAAKGAISPADLGRLLFSVAAAAQKSGLDSEEALSAECDRFIQECSVQERKNESAEK